MAPSTCATVRRAPLAAHDRGFMKLDMSEKENNIICLGNDPNISCLDTGLPRKTPSLSTEYPFSRDTSLESTNAGSELSSQHEIAPALALRDVSNNSDAGTSYMISPTQSEGTVVLDFITPKGAEPMRPLSPVPRVFQPMPATRSEGLAVQRTVSMMKKYDLREQIGSGGYGVVRKALSNEAGKLYAVKSVTHIHRETQHCYGNELILAWKVSHPFIATLVETFQDDEHLHFVMELCTGGSLDMRIKAQSCGSGMSMGPRGLPQALVTRYIWEMLAGIGYLHHHRIAHRDCKPENYMLDRPCDDAALKLIDFGLAVRFHRGTPLTERVGTPDWAAPEVNNGSYNEKCDIWSIGAVSFLCCIGLPPFTGRTPVEVMKEVRDKPVEFKKSKWDLVRPEIKTIVQSMMVKDPVARQSAKELAETNENLLAKAKKNSEKLAARKPSESCCVIA